MKQKPSALQRNDRTKPNIKGVGRGRGPNCADSNVDESQFVQMKSVFSEVPMASKSSVNSRLAPGKFWNQIADNSCFLGRGNLHGGKFRS